MILKSLIAILSAVLLPSQFALAANQCPVKDNNTLTRFELSMGDVQYNHSLNATQIQQLSQKQLAKNWYQAGLTIAKLQYQQGINVTYYDLGRGQYCMRLTEVDFKLGYADFNVYIDKKYPKNSCQYSAVLAHENRHVAINIDTLKQQFPKIERDMNAYISTLKPIHFTQSQQQLVTEQLKNKLQKQMVKLVTTANYEISRNNAKIDTKANYLEEQKQCADW